MKRILHEFYYGNISPNEKSFVQGSEYGKIIKNVSESEEKLLSLLNDDEKELLKTFSDVQGKLNEISVAEGFVDGFCLGMKIAIEVMGNQF